MVSIITINYNELATTCALLDSIRRQEFQALEVIVVDNASEENPASFFEKQYPEVKFLRSPQNLGFAGGNNLGLTLALGEYLFFVNNDVELVPGCIEQLIQLFQNQPKANLLLYCTYRFPYLPWLEAMA